MLNHKLIGFLYLAFVSHEMFGSSHLGTPQTNQPQEIKTTKLKLPQLIASADDPNQWHKSVILKESYSHVTKRHHGHNVSVLTLEQAQKLFRELKNVDYMAYHYLDNGCSDRAHEFALITQKNALFMGKAFISDKRIYEQVSLTTNPDHLLYPKRFLKTDKSPFLKQFSGWSYHVAPYLLVKNKKGQLEPFVFDIGIADAPQSIEAWQNSLLKDPTQAAIEYRDYPYIYSAGGEISHDSTIANELKIQNLSPSAYADHMLQPH